MANTSDQEVIEAINTQASSAEVGVFKSSNVTVAAAVDKDVTITPLSEDKESSFTTNCTVPSAKSTE